MVSRAKVPRTPPAVLTRDEADLLDVRPMLWRVHRTSGEHVLAWNALRTWGPLPSMRFDPHSEPLGDHPGDGVAYAATDLPTALAEVFQSTRLIDTTSFAPRATAWQPTRPLRLLRLDDTWALRNGAANALTSAPRGVCRAWAGAIRAAWPELDGLWTTSTMTGRPTVVLWAPAADSFPSRPVFSRSLNSELRAVISGLAPGLGFDVC